MPPPTPVVVLDEDDDDGSEVFIINDAAEIARAAAACNSKKGNSSGSNVINLDDDDEEDPEEGGRGDRAGPSSAAGARSPAATTPPGHSAPRNRYGLNYVSDSEQSDLSEGSDTDSDADGSSDCEILTSGAARNLWEKAASKRTIPRDPPQRKEGRASTSASSAESSTHNDENLENLFAPDCPLDDNSFWEYCAFNLAGPSSTSGSKYGTGPSSAPRAHKSPMDDVSNGKETEDHNPACSLDPDMACDDEATHSHKGPVPGKAPETSHPPHPNTTLNPEGYKGFSFVSKNRVFPACSADWKDNGRIFVSTPERMDERIPEGTSSGNDRLHAHNEISEQKKKMCFAPDDDSAMDEITEDPVSTSRHGCFRPSGEHLNKTAPRNDALEACSFPLKDLVDDPEQSGRLDIVQDGPDFQDGLIGAREKHKESDEYKRAEEEEWASRQRQLAIQAEEAKEAKRLRKRKKAEALRLLDMEKRQKQRIEEVRETQRKSEEVIQLKEHWRGAVRLELESVERTYRDVSSILHALGIPVEGGEVKAYKRALLKFHPDRVSTSNIYEQVKAEETFKFISRFKEKLKL